MKTILLADNDAAARKMVAKVLEAAGYAPVQASSESEAIAMFQALKPALVILDLQAERREAWRGFDELRRLDPLVPLIAITAWSNQCEPAMRRGIDALMEKPLDLPNLLQIMRELIRESEQARNATGAREEVPRTM